MREFKNITTGGSTAVMKQFAVIGNPIGHSLSPRLHKYVFQQLGINATYSAIQCIENQIPEIIEQLRSGQLNGINITLPLKRSVIPYLDVLSKHAQAIGAVNCISIKNGKLIGHNTDWIGFQKALENANIQVDGVTCIIVGAGGVAHSVGYSLGMNNAKKFIIINRTSKRTEDLKQLILSIFPNVKIDIAKWSELDSKALYQALIVNCTPVGMTPRVDYSPVPEKYLVPSQTIIDIIYSPFRTKLNQAGQSIGAKTISGLPMLIHQALASLDIWFGEPISEKIQMGELQNFLEKYC